MMAYQTASTTVTAGSAYLCIHGICVFAYGTLLLLKMAQLAFSLPAGHWKLFSAETVFATDTFFLRSTRHVTLQIAFFVLP